MVSYSTIKIRESKSDFLTLKFQSLILVDVMLISRLAKLFLYNCYWAKYIYDLEEIRKYTRSVIYVNVIYFCQENTKRLVEL